MTTTMATMNKTVAQLKGIVFGAMGAAALCLSHAPAVADQSQRPLYRARVDFNQQNPIQVVGVRPIAGWKEVSVSNRDPLSLAQWVPNETACSRGAHSRVSLYAVDAGHSGPNRLIQKWLPGALNFDVRTPENGFVIVRAQAERGSAQTVLAYPSSDELITPLAGWIGGVKIVFVGESTAANLNVLEEEVRKTIRNQVRVRAKNTSKLDVPFVLSASAWSKSLKKRLEAAAEAGSPNAMISLAYGIFGEANGFVPAGQALLKKAADAESIAAMGDLIRLSRRGLLNAAVEPTDLDQWTKRLETEGSEDAKYWSLLSRPFEEIEQDAKEKPPTVDPMRALAICGHPEARRMWAKHLVESFDKKERSRGRALVLAIVNNPALEGTLPFTTRVPPAVDAPALEKLKAAAILKTACSQEDGEPEKHLYVQKRDLKIDKSFGALSSGNQTKKVPLLSEMHSALELRSAQRLDTLVNSGDRSNLREAAKLACHWSGSQADRDRLVVEVVARRDGIGQWRRFRACEVISDLRLVGVCREQELQQSRLSLNAKFDATTKDLGPEQRGRAEVLRTKARAYFDRILQQSYRVAAPQETRELDRLRRQMESEFLDLLAATLSRDLENEVKEVVTSRKLLISNGGSNGSEDGLSMRRQPASAGFMKTEKARLEERLQETMRSIQQADSEDLSRDFKDGFVAAHSAWRAYLESYDQFVDASGLETTAALKSAAQLWFHIEGIYFFEKVRDREIARPRESQGADEPERSENYIAYE